MTDNINEAVVGEVRIKLTLGNLVERTGHARPAEVAVRVPITGKDIETRGLTGAALAAVNQARDALVDKVSNE